MSTGSETNMTVGSEYASAIEGAGDGDGDGDGDEGGQTITVMPPTTPMPNTIKSQAQSQTNTDSFDSRLPGSPTSSNASSKFQRTEYEWHNRSSRRRNTDQPHHRPSAFSISPLISLTNG
jgi:hypothetical protein